MCLVRPLQQGVLIAVADGVGHGPEAVEAARRALELLEESVGEHPMRSLRRCHEGLEGTRGVALSLAWIDGGLDAMTWIGVGSVEGVLQRADREASPAQEQLLLRAGVVGRQLPTLLALIVPVSPGDTLVFATDGIRGDFASDLRVIEAPERAAQRILAQHGSGTDDALVVVARYRGGSA